MACHVIAPLVSQAQDPPFSSAATIISVSKAYQSEPFAPHAFVKPFDHVHVIAPAVNTAAPQADVTVNLNPEQEQPLDLSMKRFRPGFPLSKSPRRVSPVRPHIRGMPVPRTPDRCPKQLHHHQQSPSQLIHKDNIDHGVFKEPTTTASCTTSESPPLISVGSTTATQTMYLNAMNSPHHLTTYNASHHAPLLNVPSYSPVLKKNSDQTISPTKSSSPRQPRKNLRRGYLSEALGNSSGPLVEIVRPTPVVSIALSLSSTTTTTSRSSSPIPILISPTSPQRALTVTTPSPLSCSTPVVSPNRASDSGMNQLPSPGSTRKYLHLRDRSPKQKKEISEAELPSLRNLSTNEESAAHNTPSVGSPFAEASITIPVQSNTSNSSSFNNYVADLNEKVDQIQTEIDSVKTEGGTVKRELFNKDWECMNGGEACSNTVVFEPTERMEKFLERCQDSDLSADASQLSEQQPRFHITQTSYYQNVVNEGRGAVEGPSPSKRARNISPENYSEPWRQQMSETKSTVFRMPPSLCQVPLCTKAEFNTDVPEKTPQEMGAMHSMHSSKHLSGSRTEEKEEDVSRKQKISSSQDKTSCDDEPKPKVVIKEEPPTKMTNWRSSSGAGSMTAEAMQHMCDVIDEVARGGGELKMPNSIKKAEPETSICVKKEKSDEPKFVSSMMESVSDTNNSVNDIATSAEIACQAVKEKQLETKFNGLLRCTIVKLHSMLQRFSSSRRELGEEGNLSNRNHEEEGNLSERNQEESDNSEVRSNPGMQGMECARRVTKCTKSTIDKGKGKGKGKGKKKPVTEASVLGESVECPAKRRKMTRVASPSQSCSTRASSCSNSPTKRKAEASDNGHSKCSPKRGKSSTVSSSTNATKSPAKGKMSPATASKMQKAAMAQKTQQKRTTNLLRQLQDTDGYTGAGAGAGQQSGASNLFDDPSKLSREERLLQVRTFSA